MKKGFMVNKQNEAVDIESVKFDEKGLVPAIVVDVETLLFHKAGRKF